MSFQEYLPITIGHLIFVSSYSLEGGTVGTSSSELVIQKMYSSPFPSLPSYPHFAQIVGSEYSDQIPFSLILWQVHSTGLSSLILCLVRVHSFDSHLSSLLRDGFFGVAPSLIK